MRYSREGAECRRKALAERRRSQKRQDVRGDLLALLLLQEVPSIVDRRLGLRARGGDEPAKEDVAAARDRVAIREEDERRFVPAGELGARLAHLGGAGLVGLRRHERRECLGAGLKRPIGKRPGASRCCWNE